MTKDAIELNVFTVHKDKYRQAEGDIKVEKDPTDPDWLVVYTTRLRS